MMLPLILMMLQPAGEQEWPVAPWLACLHAFERTHGRTAGSWQRMVDARQAVRDIHFAQPVVAGWQVSLYSSYLDYSPFILIALLMPGMLLSYRAWRHRRLGTSLLWCCLSFLLIIAGMNLAQPSHRPLAVIKQPGVPLRQGNGLSYPAQTKQGQPIELAAGVEAEYLTQRENGWVQVQMQDGTLGWVPLDAVYLVE